MIFNDFLLFQIFTITLINSVTPVVAIIGGRPAEDYPFFVLVPKSEQNCGGTIIAPDIVLTAAQCLYYEQQQRWALNEEVHVLHGNFSVPGAWFAKYHQGQSYLVHELYRPNNARVKNPFDIALIKVEDSFHITISTRGNKPMLTTCYMGHSTNKYGYGTMIGLGLVSQSPLTKAARLMETQLMKDNLCNGMYGSRRGKEAMQLCYGDPGKNFFKKRNEMPYGIDQAIYDCFENLTIKNFECVTSFVNH